MSSYFERLQQLAKLYYSQPTGGSLNTLASLLRTCEAHLVQAWFTNSWTAVTTLRQRMSVHELLHITPIIGHEGHEIQFQILRFCFSGSVYKVCKVFLHQKVFQQYLFSDRQTHSLKQTFPAMLSCVDRL